MKGIATIVCAVSALGLFPGTTAQAGDEGWAAFGGFVGGVLVSEFSHHAHQRTYNRRASSCHAHTVVRPAPVVVQPAPVVVYRQPPPPPPSGHWEQRAEQYWVPGQWVTRHTRCGYQNEWQPGYYATRSTKVWVEHRGGYSATPSHARPTQVGRYR